MDRKYRLNFIGSIYENIFWTFAICMNHSYGTNIFLLIKRSECGLDCKKYQDVLRVNFQYSTVTTMAIHTRTHQVSEHRIWPGWCSLFVTDTWFWAVFYGSIEFLHNSKFSVNSWQDPASIDIQWVATIKCQYWQDPARNWQKLTNYARTRLSNWMIMCDMFKLFEFFTIRSNFTFLRQNLHQTCCNDFSNVKWCMKQTSV